MNFLTDFIYYSCCRGLASCGIYPWGRNDRWGGRAHPQYVHPEAEEERRTVVRDANVQYPWLGSAKTTHILSIVSSSAFWAALSFLCCTRSMINPLSSIYWVWYRSTPSLGLYEKNLFHQNVFYFHFNSICSGKGLSVLGTLKLFFNKVNLNFVFLIIINHYIVLNSFLNSTTTASRHSCCLNITQNWLQ